VPNVFRRPWSPVTIPGVKLYNRIINQDFSQEAVLGERLEVEAGSFSNFYRAKKSFDIVSAVIGCVATLILGGLLLIFNPVFNPGPLFFRQERMGKDGRTFTLWKFRTMQPCAEGRAVRPVNTPLEETRIKALGVFLRRSRLDELPNFFNVLRGEMSVIGPRPDAWEHAVHYFTTIEQYRYRFQVLPGITGLAQVVAGYADGQNATRRKARFDKFYVQNRSISLECLVICRTLTVLMNGFGAR